VDNLKDKLLAAPRARLLRFLASAINLLTVEGRSRYDEPSEDDRLKQTNEAIHRLSGHLRDLCDEREEMTGSRADGMIESLGLLNSAVIVGIQDHSPL
jgi:hypothetical protein